MSNSVLDITWKIIVGLWHALWPVLLFYLIFKTVQSLWLYWRNRIFEMSLSFKLIELKMPREITRSPRSMDQFFHAVQGMGNFRGHLGEKYLLGELTIWFTLELVSLGGEIHFYARVFDQYVPIFKAALFAAYPEIEVVDAEDYVDEWLPHNILDMEMQGKDLYGNEFLLAKNPAYPLKTYMQFESNTEEYQVDPMAIFMEAMASVRPEEFIGVQYNFAPEKGSWSHSFQDVVEDLRTPKLAKQQAPPPMGGIDLETIRQVTLQKSPGQTKVLEAVERNLSKPAFSVNIRLIYISPRRLFSDKVPRRAMRGAFGQYNAADLNSLVFNERLNTKPGWFDPPFVFKRTRRRARKNRLLHMWHEREFGIHEWMGKWLSGHWFNTWGSRTDILSSESMATLIHPPTALVTTGPLTQRVESRKMGAPAGLPIYADETVLDKFK